MDASLQAEADRRFSEALASTGARDPRDYYRERLKELRVANPAEYDDAVSYYQEKLIPRVADRESDPTVEWRAYGMEIARLTAPGRPVLIDASGRAQPFKEPCPPDGMVLHLPDGRGPAALLVGLPTEPSSAQLATYDWLVGNRRALRQAASTM